MFFLVWQVLFPEQLLWVMCWSREGWENTLCVPETWNSLVFIKLCRLFSQRQRRVNICCLTSLLHHSVFTIFGGRGGGGKYWRMVWQDGSETRGRWWVMIIWCEEDDSRPQTVTRHFLTLCERAHVVCLCASVHVEVRYGVKLCADLNLITAF